MAFCMNCGKQLPDGAKFCQECGTKLGDIKAEQTTKRETIYEGKIYKCPNCGDLMDPFEIKCDVCGYELRSAKATNSVKEFEHKLENIESIELRTELIKTFAIPNAKEDVVEFLIYASSNLCLNGSLIKSTAEIALNNAWLVKFDQAYQKAYILSTKDQSLEALVKKYEKTYKAAKETNASLISNKEFTKLGIFAIALFLMGMAFVGMLLSFAF